MAEPAVVSGQLTIVRRNRKGALTRSLKSLETLMEADAESKTINETFEKAKRQWEAVEAAHQELVDTLEEEEAFETEEDWMSDAEDVFMAARVKVEKYLARSVNVVNDNSNDDVVPAEVVGQVAEPGVQLDGAEPINNVGSNVVVAGSNSASSIDADRSQPQGSSAVQSSQVEPVSSNVQTSGSSAVKSDSALSELKLALELPKAEIAEFHGDAIKYWSFIKNFEINVASKLSNDSTRLQYLLQLCKGNAKSCIESCALLGDEGYNCAKSILKRNFGQPHLILNALMNDLTDRKAIKAHDGGALRELISCMQTCQVTLTQMGYVTDLNSTSNLLRGQGLLPVYMQTAWAKAAQRILKDREPIFLDLLTFLEGQAEIACNMFGKSIGTNKSCNVSKTNDERPKAKSNYVKSNAKSLKCFACDGEHRLFDCEGFMKMSYDERLGVVKTKRLCFRCLFPGHSIAKCRRETTCSSCKSTKHHVLLHINNTNNSSNPSVNSNAAICGSQVFLRILPVKVTGVNGNQASTLALLDSGSDTSLCSEVLQRDLGISGKSMSYTSSTINGDQSRVGSVFDLSVQGRNEADSINVTFLSVPDLPNSGDSLPTPEEFQKWDHLRSISWGNVSHLKVGLLIGADAPEAFWIREERRGRPKDPYGIRTLLGWSVMGPGGSNVHKRVCNNRISCCSNEEILNHLKKSWSVDDPEHGEGESVEDTRARAIMDSTTTRTEDGHYQMGLLWKDTECTLPSNRSLAEIRLTSLKRKLERNEDLLKNYTETMDGYIAKGYAEPVLTEGPLGRTWHLPHHPVIHPQKGKLRVVFDCAAKWRGASLNECLLKGPDTMNSLVGVLLRFRQQRVALVADVEAMFHQAKVVEEDRDALRFLWWPGGRLHVSPKEYRMTVHLFGATSSPACAAYALRRAADDNKENNKDPIGLQAVRAINDDFYVDDLLSSTSNEDVAVELVERLRQILKDGGFRLTKWLSNSRQVLNSIPASERAPTITNIDELPTERTLGVSWNAEVDTFKFKVSLQEKPFTRRGLLSMASQIFGLWCPIHTYR